MVQQLLLIGQVVVVVLVWLLAWRMVRSARRDLQAFASPGGVREHAGPGSSSAGAGAPAASQDSTIIPAAEVARARAGGADGAASPAGGLRLVVEDGTALRPGVPFTVGTGGLSLGRADSNDIVLDDQAASSRHVRIEQGGVVVDQGSTNGTWVNDARVSSRARLRPGDRLRVGTTTFRVEAT